MSQPTPTESVERMIARKERLIERIMESATMADPRRPSTTQMATDAVRIAEAQGAIDALKEVLEEMQAFVAPSTPFGDIVAQHREHCSAKACGHGCCLDVVGA